NVLRLAQPADNAGDVLRFCGGGSLEFGCPGHATPPETAATMAQKRSNISVLSSGPGQASEWYWMVSSGSVRSAMPSTVWSFRFRWLTYADESRPSGSMA